MARRLGVVVAMGAFLLSACADSNGSAASVPAGAEEQLLDATFLLVPPGCAGVLLDDGQFALTAAHCLSGSGEELTLELRDGSRLAASVESVDDLGDVAILRLEEPDPGRAGLAIAPSVPDHGAVLFAGRPDRDTGLQVAQVLRVGRCSSLPDVDAIFTTIDGAPGDSGAPVTDLQLRLIGLVHGGAACHIVTPVAGALASMERRHPRLRGGRLLPALPRAALRAGPRPELPAGANRPAPPLQAEASCSAAAHLR